MHCVSIYPIPTKDFQLNFIDVLKERYKGRTIGWSTHEDQDETAPVQIAMAKGASMFERHVGCKTDEIKLNLYSSTPEQLDVWFGAYKHAQELCGLSSTNNEKPITDVERESLEGLQRGIFAKKDIDKGVQLTRKDVFFAMPFTPGQISAENWVEGGIVTNKKLKVNDPIFPENIKITKKIKNIVLKKSIHQYKAMLNKASIALNSEFGIEFSHHYGVDNFAETGALLIDCINRDYCKKLVLVFTWSKTSITLSQEKRRNFSSFNGSI